MTEPSSASAVRPAAPEVGSGRAVLAGMIAAAAALGIGELLAGLVRGIPSPLAAVGTAAIDFAPPGSKQVVVSLFGTNDKTALLVLVLVAVLVFGAVIGWFAMRRIAVAGWLVVGLVAVGGLASLRDPTAVGPLVVVAAALQAGVGLQVLVTLLAAARQDTVDATNGRARTIATGARNGLVAAAARLDAQGVGHGADSVVAANSNLNPAPATPGRRAFLVQTSVVSVLAVIGGFVGRTLLSGRADATAAEGLSGSGAGTSGTGNGAPIAIPPVVDPAPTPGPDASLSVPGITPLVVPNGQFYRIDTALITPSVDLTSWSLRVFGMVDKEVRLSFADLVQLPLIERYVTIACVSNEVGGNLVGNAKWAGPRLSDVLAMAGVQAGATQIVPRSVDGWTAGFPTAWVTDPAHPRDAIIAVKMNDAPLPAEHGFPARLIVPGLYGYVSATKWLTEIELTTLEAIDAYWVPRGWAKEAPILTQSRIDVPQSGAQVAAGPVADGGDWQPAILATELSASTWVQWKWIWQATAGQHVLEVRATDGTGIAQTDQATPPNPDGARGYHRIAVQVG